MDDISRDGFEIERLSEDDVHDLVLITIARSHTDAIILIDKLAEECVPAIMQERSMGGISLPNYGTVDIYVPRVLADKALALIAKAQGIDIPENQDEQTAAKTNGLFHVHLSTMLVTVAVAGLMLMLNFTANAQGKQGFPFELHTLRFDHTGISPDAAAYNAVCCTFIVLAIAFLLEWWERTKAQIAKDAQSN